MEPPTALRIGEVARLVGVSVSTLRLWETQGLVTPHRLESGQRIYSPENVEALREIQRLRQDEGLNAAAIRTTLVPRRSSSRPRSAARTGPRLRALRRASGLTLGRLAEAIGIAPSVLSTFERTSQGIAFKTLSDLARYFGTSVSELSGDGTREGRPLVRAGQWRRWPETTPGVTVQLLAEGRNQMDCHRFVLAPGASSEGAYRHEGEEFMHILTGRLEVTLDGLETVVLDPGDSLYFASSRHHAWRNIHDGETILIWINTPPTF
ncbi:MerR family transcriptional regulator [Arsenicitalea aurantiaca]|uniref:MerR family transcriptional regulator n=1 Tax=Arsenicitalea aurantiaca TaxID=1783274 RepID=A0A433X7L4_9HYPH|nr:MerR family transcriptional regulator [Arsenicitalea aurantiaca]RUT30081.1 MerR family transcriptional regulator [Arsenicitalea aurantiaca]